MVFTMQEHKNVLIRNCLEKSRQALSDAGYPLKDGRKNLVLNRLYYSIFYSVLAIGYKDEFVTSKHAQLMGWFNKKYIYENKIFDKRMNEIYKAAFINRQEADYDISKPMEIRPEQLQESINDVKYFIGEIEK
jgi:uncharacterized protein (UPF0332 family)